eukprot:3744684-Rhodomonas_salina.1
MHTDLVTVLDALHIVTSVWERHIANRVVAKYTEPPAQQAPATLVAKIAAVRALVEDYTSQMTQPSWTWDATRMCELGSVVEDSINNMFLFELTDTKFEPPHTANADWLALISIEIPHILTPLLDAF